MTEGYHPLHVQYSQKMSQSGEDAETGLIPVKVGISGVMPVIFASSLMAIPQLIAAIAGKGYGSGLSKIVLNMMSQKNWFDNDNPVYGLGFDLPGADCVLCILLPPDYIQCGRSI